MGLSARGLPVEINVPPGVHLLCVTHRDGRRRDVVVHTAHDSGGVVLRFWAVDVAEVQRLEVIPVTYPEHEIDYRSTSEVP